MWGWGWGEGPATKAGMGVARLPPPAFEERAADAWTSPPPTTKLAPSPSPARRPSSGPALPADARTPGHQPTWIPPRPDALLVLPPSPPLPDVGFALADPSPLGCLPPDTSVY